MFATTTRTADPRPVIKAAWAALILAAVVAAGAVIAVPKAPAGGSAPAVSTNDDRGLDGAAFRRAPASGNGSGTGHHGPRPRAR